MNEFVERGVAWFDANGPEGWRSKIDKDRLNLNIYSDCVLSQVYGDFFSTDLDGHELVQNGFDLHICGRSNEEMVEQFERLTNAWKAVL